MYVRFAKDLSIIMISDESQELCERTDEIKCVFLRHCKECTAVGDGGQDGEWKCLLSAHGSSRRTVIFGVGQVAPLVGPHAPPKVQYSYSSRGKLNVPGQGDHFVINTVCWNGQKRRALVG